MPVTDGSGQKGRSLLELGRDQPVLQGVGAHDWDRFGWRYVERFRHPEPPRRCDGRRRCL